MERLDEKILHLFRRDPSQSFSTTDIIRELFPTAYRRIKQQLLSPEKREVRKGYAEKAKLHRRVLYHLNRLVKEEILAVTGVHGKGEKLFGLAMEEGELIIQSRQRKIVIAKPTTLTTPVDGYEHEGLIRKYAPHSWLNKENAILLEAGAYHSLTDLQQHLQRLFPAVNDVIALNTFEQLLQQNIEGASDFLTTLGLDAHDYDTTVSLIINLASLKEEDFLLKLLKERLPSAPRQLTFIFNVTPRIIARKEAFFKELFTLFAETQRKLTLKNNSLYNPPLFFGRAGAYAFTINDWEYYKKSVKNKAHGCVVGQLSMVVDIKKYFTNGTISGFRELAKRAAHTFFEVEEQRRKHFSEYFGYLKLPNPDASKEFFKVGRHYLRFWNYDWDEAAESPIFDLLSSVKEEVEKFCTMQETIFKSCGLPIRFRVALSTTFAKFDRDFFSERRYKKTAIRQTKELQTETMKAYLAIREQLFKVFEGADRLRFFIARGTPVDEVLRISRYLLSAYDLPSFTLDFRGKTGELKLTQFLEE